MSKYLGKIVDVFQLRDRLVIQSDTLYEKLDPGYKSGDLLELRRPDGSRIKSKSWAESFFPTNMGRPACLSVEDSLQKSDLPIGTELWLVRDD